MKLQRDWNEVGETDPYPSVAKVVTALLDWLDEDERRDFISVALASDMSSDEFLDGLAHLVPWLMFKVKQGGVEPTDLLRDIASKLDE